jgi:hypothetical protein
MKKMRLLEGVAAATTLDLDICQMPGSKVFIMLSAIGASYNGSEGHTVCTDSTIEFFHLSDIVVDVTLVLQMGHCTFIFFQFISSMNRAFNALVYACQLSLICMRWHSARRAWCQVRAFFLINVLT